VGIVHQQGYQRDHTIDDRPLRDPIAERFERLEARLDRLEALVTQLTRDALRDAVTETVTRDAVTRDAQGDTGDAQRVPGDGVTKRHAHAERQRRYRERKKQRPGT
jgi:hypothetical protein